MLAFPFGFVQERFVVKGMAEMRSYALVVFGGRRLIFSRCPLEMGVGDTCIGSIVKSGVKRWVVVGGVLT